MIHPNKEIMQRAIDFATENNSDVGAVIVKGDEILALAFTSANQDHDPTCHAEINAIRIAAKKLDSKKLENCYIYSTYEPCPMCASAVIWARMKGIIFGADMDDETERCPQRIKIKCSEIIKKGEPKVELYPDFMREECKKLLLK